MTDRSSSPPCNLDGADPAYTGLQDDRRAVMAWRRETRTRLIEARKAIPTSERQAADAAISAHLDALLGPVDGQVVSLYWPFRGEPDLRGWGATLIGRGARLALPVVEVRNAPLVFRPWRPGDRLTRGIWNIPVPDTRETVVPDVVLAPVVGFDAASFRLGYGGGYFDRTLASLSGWRAFGVGLDLARLDTIHPLPHDVPLDAVVTPSGVAARRQPTSSRPEKK